MPIKDLFEKPFDDGTLIKLDLYRQYLKEWLPVFVAKKPPAWRTVQIFDLFAGQGKDVRGTLGSPLIAIEIIDSLKDLIVNNGVEVILHLNELERNKLEILHASIGEQKRFFKIRLYNQEFISVFNEQYPSMKSSANFIFLDQNGIKQVTAEVFNKITALKQTDFLFYISSSYFRRFSTTEEFSKYFPFDPEELASIDYYHIHRKVLNHYKNLIQAGKHYFLAPFSIKKEKNIYGLIFGTNHTFGMEKFLKVAWKLDRVRGEANYDIDSEKISEHAPSLFEEFNHPTKRKVFEQNLSANILNKSIETTYDAYFYGLNEGFLLKDVNNVLNSLKKEKKIVFEGNGVSGDLHKHKSERINLL